MQSNLSNRPFCISASINNSNNKKAFLTRGSPPSCVSVRLTTRGGIAVSASPLGEESAGSYETWPRTNALYSLSRLIKGVGETQLVLLRCLLASEDPTRSGRIQATLRVSAAAGRAHTLVHVTSCAPAWKTGKAKRGMRG